MNILVYTPDTSASWERCARPWHLIQKKLPGLKITFCTANSAVPFQATWDIAGFYDLAFLHRPFHPDVAQAARVMKRMGVKIWVDYDDLLPSVPWHNPSSRVYNAPQYQDAICEILDCADILTATTKTLLDLLNSPATIKEVVPNGHDFSVFNKPRAFDPNGPKNVMWRGSDTHRRDLLTFRDPIEKAIQDNPDWKFLFVGMRPDVLKHRDNMVWVPPIERTVFEDGLASLKPRVMMVPLEDTEFNRCKSNIAAIHGVYAGAIPFSPCWEDGWMIPGSVNYGTPEDFGLMLDVAMAGNTPWNNPEVRMEWLRSMSLEKANEKRIEILKKCSACGEQTLLKENLTNPTI